MLLTKKNMYVYLYKSEILMYMECLSCFCLINNVLRAFSQVASFQKHMILFFIVIQLQLSAFSPHLSTPSLPNPPPSPTSTLPLDFVLVSFIVVPVNPPPPTSPPHSPLAIVRLLMEFYAAERKKELLPFGSAWMELESIMLSEISQAVRDKYHLTSPSTGT